MKIENLVRPNILSLKPYSSARDEFALEGKESNELIFLDANEFPYENGINRYPDPLQQKLKRKICTKLGGNISNLLIGNGSDEIIDLLLRAFCNPGKDALIISSPSYGMYQVLAQINHVKLIDVPLNQNFEMDTDAIINAAKDETVKVIFICSPNNPTGQVFPKKEILKILTNTHKLVLIDEAYIQFSDKESMVQELNNYPNLVVLQTLSKLFGMAGLRLGLCWASKVLINLLNNLKLPYNVNTLSQEKAIELLDKINIKQRKEENSLERNKMNSFLETLTWVEKVYPSDANFILFRCDNAPSRYLQLLKKGIVVRNRSQQLHCENCLRISIGTSAQNQKIQKLLKNF